MFANEVMQRWEAAWPGVRPIGHEIRYGFRERWVRFHSLPGSKRYADTDAEERVVLTRYLTVLGELVEGPRSPLWVVTSAYGEDPRPVPQPPEAASVLPGALWCSVADDVTDPDPAWISLYLSECHLEDPALRELLRLRADDVLDSLVVFDGTFAWNHAPYDGGADVVLSTTSARDRLRSAHPDWLSAHPLGL